MNERLLARLAPITPEEERLLHGASEIDRSLYMREDSEEVDCHLLLEKGKLITLRPHTRFVRFPRHTHNYVEMVYMCRGKTVHKIDGTTIELKEGELLLLNQNAVQEIYPAGQDDIAVNFIILPQFFDTAISLIGENDHQIRDFLIRCLLGNVSGMNYFHFEVADVLPIQNLVENLIWTLVHHQPNRRSIYQLTMGLLFLQLANHTDALRTAPQLSEQQILLRVLRYIEEHYKEGTLSELSETLHYDMSWLSREIKRRSGKTFTELVQNKRLSQAEFLLRTTSIKVIDIAESVGYENISYFHRIFKKRFGVSPYQYRKCK